MYTSKKHLSIRSEEGKKQDPHNNVNLLFGHSLELNVHNSCSVDTYIIPKEKIKLYAIFFKTPPGQLWPEKFINVYLLYFYDIVLVFQL